jgi:hypothetical protein
MEVNGLGGFFRLETANQGRISKKGRIQQNTIISHKQGFVSKMSIFNIASVSRII